MTYSEMFKINAKVILRNSYALELALEEGSDIIGNWIIEEKKFAKDNLNKEEYEKLDNLYFMWLLERR